MEQLQNYATKKPNPKQQRTKIRKQKSRNEQSANIPMESCCPICLQEIEKADTVLLPTCRHTYCVYCIVQWAEDKTEAACPQCKKKFDSLWTFRKLDGTVCNSLMKESICLIKNTHWFKSYKARVQNAALCGSRRTDEDEDSADDYYEENEIDDAEDFYFSNAAGSARIVLSNRTFGKNGFIRSGRVFAQNSSATGSTDNHPNSITAQAQRAPKERKTNPKGQRAKRREDKKKQDANRIF